MNPAAFQRTLARDRKYIMGTPYGVLPLAIIKGVKSGRHSGGSTFSASINRARDKSVCLD
jgi:hypothetical protein